MKYRPLEFFKSYLECIKDLEQLNLNGFSDQQAWEAYYKYIKKETGISNLPSEYESELYFSFLRSYVLEGWRRNKQVYTFSEEFYNMLCTMEDIQPEVEMFECLPYNSFYIELAVKNKYDGIFVKFDKISNKLFFILVFKKEGSSIFVIKFEEKLTVKQLCESITRVEYKELDRISKRSKNTISNAHSLNELLEILTFAIQATMYLCATNSHIEENEAQKKIYKVSPNSIKDRYAEVRKWDVGYRLSAEERVCVRDFKIEDSNTETELLCKRRNRPRQHWRRAHWHTYLVGKGRTEKVLRFIPPTLVNNIEDELPVVNHLVKKD